MRRLHRKAASSCPQFLKVPTLQWSGFDPARDQPKSSCCGAGGVHESFAWQLFRREHPRRAVDGRWTGGRQCILLRLAMNQEEWKRPSRRRSGQASPPTLQPFSSSFLLPATFGFFPDRQGSILSAGIGGIAHFHSKILCFQARRYRLPRAPICRVQPHDERRERHRKAALPTSLRRFLGTKSLGSSLPHSRYDCTCAVTGHLQPLVVPREGSLTR